MIDPARAVLLAAAAGLVVLVVRLPRIEERVLGAQARAAVPERPEVMPAGARPLDLGEPGLGPEGHRAYAQALHAVTAAYLAECEREARG